MGGAAEGGATNPVAITRTMLANEGVAAFYKGLSAGLTRQVVYTGARLGLYDKFVDVAKVPGENMPFWKTAVCALSAGGIAGVFASFFSLPFDYVKTQVQKMKPDPKTGEMPFKGPLDCAWKQVQAGGPLRLWSGFPTYYARIAPHAMVTLIAQDNIKKFWGSVGL